LLRPLMLLYCSSRAQDQGLSPDDISALIAEHDSNKDGVIDYQEFLAMMRWVLADEVPAVPAGFLHFAYHVS
jgi:EF hand